jgi:hypothetical protein
MNHQQFCHHPQLLSDVEVDRVPAEPEEEWLKKRIPLSCRNWNLLCKQRFQQLLYLLTEANWQIAASIELAMLSSDSCHDSQNCLPRKCISTMIFRISKLSRRNYTISGDIANPKLKVNCGKPVFSMPKAHNLFCFSWWFVLGNLSEETYGTMMINHQLFEVIQSKIRCKNRTNRFSNYFFRCKNPQKWGWTHHLCICLSGFPHVSSKKEELRRHSTPRLRLETSPVWPKRKNLGMLAHVGPGHTPETWAKDGNYPLVMTNIWKPWPIEINEFSIKTSIYKGFSWIFHSYVK